MLKGDSCNIPHVNVATCTLTKEYSARKNFLAENSAGTHACMSSDGVFDRQATDTSCMTTPIRSWCHAAPEQASCAGSWLWPSLLHTMDSSQRLSGLVWSVHCHPCRRFCQPSVCPFCVVVISHCRLCQAPARSFFLHGRSQHSADIDVIM